MDDKYSETNANSETAPDKPAGALEVSATGTSDASKFSKCYFIVSGTNWSLYNNGGHLLQSGTTSQTTFSFDHDSQNPGNPNSAKINWTITGFSISSTSGSGSWSNNNPAMEAGPQSGSFEASSGGGIDPVSASASA